MSSYTIERISHPAAWKQLRAEWTELASASPSDCVFLTWEWLWSWWQNCAGRRRLWLLVCRNRGQLAAIAPLAQRPAARWQPASRGRLEFLGSGIVGSDYLDLLVRQGQEAAIAAMAEYLAASGLALDLRQVRAESSASSQLLASLAGAGWSHRTMQTHVCPWIDLRGQTWDSYLATLGSAHRYNFGRRLRNLHKQFEVRLELAASEEQRRNWLATLISLHRQRWEPRGGSDAFPDSAVVAFHEQFTRLALERGWLRLYGLTLNRAPAAALYGLRYRRKFYFYQSGMDPRFQRHSAGLVLMGLAIRAAIEEAAEEFDMLHGDEAYKFHWASQARSLARWQADPPGAWSGIERAVDHARRRAGWLAQHVLPLRVLRSLQAYRRRSEWKAS